VSSDQQVVDEYDGRNHQQQMDQPAAHLPNEAEQPQHQQHHEDRPEHLITSFVGLGGRPACDAPSLRDNATIR
jgi:hypothetical protein